MSHLSIMAFSHDHSDTSLVLSQRIVEVCVPGGVSWVCSTCQVYVPRVGDVNFETKTIRATHHTTQADTGSEPGPYRSASKTTLQTKRCADVRLKECCPVRGLRRPLHLPFFE